MPKYQEELKYQRAPDARTVRVAGGTIVNFWQQGDAELLGGYTSGAYPRKSEDAWITGTWTFDSLTGNIQTTTTSNAALFVVGGTQVIAKAAGVLAEALVIPDNTSAGTHFTLTIADPPDGGYLFEDGDRVRVHAILEDTDFAHGSEYTTWFALDNRQDVGDGTQTYDGNWRIGDDNCTYPAGSAVIDYGASGDGFITTSADDTNAPFINISTHAGNPWSTTTSRVHIGNMNGEFGISSDYYGMGVGDYSGGNYLRYETSGGFVISAGGSKCTVDADGYKIIAGSVWAAVQSYRFVDASDNYFTGLAAYYDGTADTGYLEVDARTGQDGKLLIYADGASSSETGLIQLRASRAGGDLLTLNLDSDGPADKQIASLTGGDLRIGEGLYVGSTATDPDTDDVWCDGEISTDGGTTKWDLGGYTGGAPTPTGYLEVVVEGTTYKLSAELVEA